MTDAKHDVPTTSLLTGSRVGAVEDELVDLYAACYADPPWSEGPEEVAGYRQRLRVWAAEATFAGLVARRDDGTLAGATYGWRGAPRVGGAALPGIDADEVFHVGDLMVHPSARNQGLGRRLLDQLVAGRRPAVLVTHPDSRSRRLYEAAGWRHTGPVSSPHLGHLGHLATYALT